MPGNFESLAHLDEDDIELGECHECGAITDIGFDYLCMPCREIDDAEAEGGD